MRKVITQLLRISDDQYSRFVYETGIAFAEDFYGKDDWQMITLITGSKEYWKWYKNQFRQIDELFVHRYGMSEAEPKMLRAIWENDHQPDKLDAFPGKLVVFEEMQQLWDNFSKQSNKVNV